MSLICIKKLEDGKKSVSYDTRSVDANGCIMSEDEEKVIKLKSKKVYVGSCGDVDIKDAFFEYCLTNEDKIMMSKTVLVEFVRAFIDECAESKVKMPITQSFIFINKASTVGVFYDNDTDDIYTYFYDGDVCAFGYAREYAMALLDVGYSTEDAIKQAAKRYVKVNDKPKTIEIS